MVTMFKATVHTSSILVDGNNLLKFSLNGNKINVSNGMSKEFVSAKRAVFIFNVLAIADVVTPAVLRKMKFNTPRKLLS